MLVIAPCVSFGNPSTVLQRIEFEDLKASITLPNTLIIDARPCVFYELGHIPNAINLPLIDFELSLKKVSENYDLKKFKRIILYCSDNECDDSAKLGQKLTSLGCVNILVYKGGWREWKERQK